MFKRITQIGMSWTARRRVWFWVNGLFIMLILTVISGCNLPGLRSTPEAPTPTAEISLPLSGAVPPDGAVSTVIPFALPAEIGDTSAIIWFPTGGKIALAGSTGLTLIEPGQPNYRPQTAGDIQTQSINTDSPLIVSNARNAEVVGWSTANHLIYSVDLSTNEPPRLQDASDAPVTGIAVSPDGDRVAYATYDGMLKISSSAVQPSAQAALSWELPAWLSNLSFSPDGRTIGGVDLPNFTVYLINSESGAVERILEWLESPGSALYGVAFSPDWTKLAWASQNAVQVMNVADGRLGPLLNHADPVSVMAWSTNSARLATGAAAEVDGDLSPAVLIWDPVNGSLVQTLLQVSAVRSLAFSPDGSQIAVLDSNGNLQVWNLEQ